MLTNLTLQNFQCHEKLEIPLSQITTIVGGSDVGKSAIVRALNFVCFNSLRGNSFITHGRDKCSVTLEVDGQTIRRIKTKTSNSYTTETDEYSAVSSEVPPEIAKILNIDEINVANQHDPLFWFSLTSGQLAKELNAIADIAWVDRVLQVSVSDLRKINAEIDVTNNRIVELEAEAKQMEWVPQAEEELQRLESLETKINKIGEAHRKLTDLIDRLESIKMQTEQSQEIVDAFEPVQKRYAVADLHRKGYERLDSLLASIPDTHSLQAAVTAFTPVCEAYTVMDGYKQQGQRLEALLSTIPDVIPSLEEVEKLQKRMKNLTDIEVAQSRLTEMLAHNKDYGSQIHVLSQELRGLEQELIERSEGLCPICHTPLPS
jgi:DNA repair exonuclease SbcCD ATPase subunit